MSRWEKKRPTAAEKRAAAREKALEQCAKGNHTDTPTFRSGETACTTCGIVNYCPDCLSESNLQPPFIQEQQDTIKATIAGMSKDRAIATLLRMPGVQSVSITTKNGTTIPSDVQQIHLLFLQV